MIPNDIRDAAELGYLSTTEMGRALGLPAISHTWIVSVLGIQPSLRIRKGNGVYWSKEKVAQIRIEIIKHLQKLTDQAVTEDERPAPLSVAMVERLPKWSEGVPDAAPNTEGLDMGLPVFEDADGKEKILIRSGDGIKKLAVDGQELNRRRLSDHGGLVGILGALEAEIDSGLYEFQEDAELIGAHALIQLVAFRSTDQKELLRPIKG